MAETSGSLAGKTLFVSGASRGIGLAIALRAAKDGANVAIAAKTDKPHPKLPGTIHTAAEEIEAAGGKALPVVCDIRDEDAVQAAVDHVDLAIKDMAHGEPAERLAEHVAEVLGEFLPHLSLEAVDLVHVVRLVVSPSQV